MAKITEYYLNKASYIAVDENGHKFDINIDYWEGNFKVSQENQELQNYAEKLVKKKHRVNFVHKIQESKEG